MTDDTRGIKIHPEKDCEWGGGEVVDGKEGGVGRGMGE